MTSGVVGLLVEQDGAPVSEGARRSTGEEDDEDEEAVSDRHREGGGRTGGGGCRCACVGEGQARGRRWRGMEGRRRRGRARRRCRRELVVVAGDFCFAPPPAAEGLPSAGRSSTSVVPPAGRDEVLAAQIKELAPASSPHRHGCVCGRRR
jgi:hypothetical protein